MHVQEDQAAVWLSRPAPTDTLEAIVKNVRCLRELRRVLMDAMMEEYREAVDIYLGIEKTQK